MDINFWENAETALLQVDFSLTIININETTQRYAQLTQESFNMTMIDINTEGYADIDNAYGL